MTTPHVSLMVARMHAVLVTRPGSPVYHVYAGPLTPSGRYAPSAARTACSARTRRLSVIRRIGVTVDLAGRRMCARCSARLSAVARRAEQPPSNIDARTKFWQAAEITSTDLVHALAVATSVEETHAVGNVTNLLFGPVHTTATRRPAEPGKAQARWDFEAELVRRRGVLRNAERSPEEVEAAAAKRETQAAREQQIAANRKQADRMNRALDRRLNDQYLMPHQKELLDSA